MISLKEHKVALLGLKHTIDALEDFNKLIEYYSQEKLGPAYLAVRYVTVDPLEIQLDRSVILPALTAQRQRLVDYLAELGIDARDYVV